MLIDQKAIHSPVPIVRAGPGDDVDDPSRGPPELSDSARGDHLKLADHLLAQKCSRQVGRVVIGREPIDHKPIVDVPLAGDIDLRSRDGRRLGEPLVGDRIPTGDPRRQGGQVEVVSPVQRQGIDLARQNGLGDLRPDHFDDRRLRNYLDAPRNTGDRQIDRQTERLPDAQGQCLLPCRKTIRLDHQLIVSNRKI